MTKTVLFCFLIFSGALYAQENKKYHGPIITDRPDQTESPFLIPKGLLQIETGFSYEESTHKHFREKFITLNTSLVRYGLLDNLELRLGFEIGESRITRTNIPGENVASGLSPLFAGFKIGVAKEKGLLPQIGFLGGIMLPFTAEKAFKPAGTGGEFRFAFGHTLSDKLGFSYNVGAMWNGEDPYLTYLYSMVVGYSFTDRASGFIGSIWQYARKKQKWAFSMPDLPIYFPTQFK